MLEFWASMLAPATGIRTLLRKVRTRPFVDLLPGGFEKLGNNRNCPWCNTAALSINEKDGVVLFHCHHCQLGGNAINLIMKVSGLDEKAATKEFTERYGNGARATKRKEQNLLPYSVEEYARDSGLPESYLREEWGITDGNGYVLTPWGSTKQLRFANGKRWLKNKYPTSLYGADSPWLDIGDKDYIFITEGARNTQTLAYAGHPVLGSPSCNFKEEYAADPHIQRADIVYAIEDPPTDRDQTSGKDFVQRIANALPNKKVYAVRLWQMDANGKPSGFKDANEAWLLGGPALAPESEFGLEMFHDRLYAATQSATLVTPEGWQEPVTSLIPTELPPVQEFKLSFLPKALQGIAADVAQRLSVPKDFCAVYGIAALAAATGQRALVQPKQADATWKKPLNLWGGLIDDSGARKTPVYSTFFKILKQIDTEWHEEFAAKLRAWKDRSVKPDFDEELDPKPKARDLVVNFATAAKFHEMCSEEYDNQAGIFTQIDEMVGWLASLEQEYQRGTARPFFMSCWSGERNYKWSTVGRGTVYAPNVLMSIFGNFVPAKLASFIKTNQQEADGMVQRFQILVQPDPARPLHVDVPEDTKARELYEKVIRRMASLKFESVLLQFSTNGQEIFRQWEIEIDILHERETISAKRGHLKKYVGLMPTLAALFQLADHFTQHEESEPTLRIDVDHAKQAVDVCKYLLSHLDRIYGSLPKRWHNAIQPLASKIQAGALKATFTVRDISEKDWSGLKDIEDVREALAFLEKRHWIRSKQVSTGGRPSVKYSVNPAIWKAD